MSTNKKTKDYQEQEEALDRFTLVLLLGIGAVFAIFVIALMIMGV